MLAKTTSNYIGIFSIIPNARAPPWAVFLLHRYTAANIPSSKPGGQEISVHLFDRRFPLLLRFLPHRYTAANIPSSKPGGQAQSVYPYQEIDLGLTGFNVVPPPATGGQQQVRRSWG